MNVPSLDFIKHTVREKGLFYCVKFCKKQIILSVIWVVRSSFKRLAWVFPSFQFIFWGKKIQSKRILAIWDLQAVPYSIGDLLNLNQAMLCLSYIHKVEKIDICFVCDPKRPARYPDHTKIIDLKNYQYHLNPLIPIIQINQKFGSFFLFDSYLDLERFIDKNLERYIIWPQARKYFVKEGYTENFNFIIKFFEKHGFIPFISCQLYTLEWASNFIKKNSLPLIPIVVHIRNNPISRVYSNSRVEAWLDFFNFCNGRYPVKFFLIGLKKEIDVRFHTLPNVLIVKDYHTTLEEDLALIQISPLYLGVPSGMAQMAIFSDKPYLLVNFQTAHESIPSGAQIPFAKEFQKIIWESETGAMLIEEFSKLYSSNDFKSWERQINTMEYCESKIRIR